MKPGDPIEFYMELLCVCIDPEVYISRRSLKHFVESRSGEMKDRTKEDIIKYLYFAIDNLEYTLHTYNSIEFQEDYKKYIYTKHFGKEMKSSIRIVTEIIESHQEIKSIHYKKNKKATK